MGMGLRLAVIFAVFGGTVCLEKSKVVNTKYGNVEGYLSSNELYYEFLGIRYGIPVKFRSPEEPPSFLATYKADNRAVLCPQFQAHDPLGVASDNEDCLVLNVYAPSHHRNTSLPVIVFLHGGGFGIGSGSPTFFGPQYIVSHDVILVTVNYRLNCYGFLNLGIEDAPGNAGLKDIRAALRWVKDNIGEFKGDPNNVTVFGQGSGGVAALYLLLSQSTKGLFHKVISASGTFFTPHSFDSNPLNTASQLAKCLGVNTQDKESLLRLYSETPINRVEEAISQQMNAKSLFLPSVEYEFDDEEAFLTDSPINILSKGFDHDCFNPVPIMMGQNIAEGLASILDYKTITSQMDRIENGDYKALDQRNLCVPKTDIEEFRHIIKETYFSDLESEDGLIGGVINLNTDFSYVGPMSLFTEMYANNSGMPLYSYIFDYIGSRNFGRLLTNCSLPATTHQDELYYLFELERLPLPMDENDARMINFMCMMWTNFAKFGTPTPDPENGEWLPYPHHLAIDLEPRYVAPLTPDRAYFWRTFFYQYGVHCPSDA